MTSKQNKPDNYVQSVDRALQLLLYITAQRDPVSINTLSNIFALNRTTVWRLLSSLEKNGFIERDTKSKSYVPGINTMTLCADTSVQYSPLIRHSRPIMEELCKKTQESILLSVPKHFCTLTIAQIDPPQAIRLKDYSNTASKLHCSSNGKVLLACYSKAELDEVLSSDLEAFTQNTITNRDLLIAEIDKTRDRGFGIVLGELDEFENGVSAPIMQRGKLIALLNISGPAFRFKESNMLNLAPILLSACKKIEVLL